MKKLTLILLFFATFLYGQIKVETEEKAKTISWVNDVFIKKTTEDYFLCFYNMKYSTLRYTSCITIPNKENNFEELYKIIINGFENFSEDKLKVDISGNTIWLQYHKILGVILVDFSIIEYGQIMAFSNDLTKKQVQKLFNIKH